MATKGNKKGKRYKNADNTSNMPAVSASQSTQFPRVTDIDPEKVARERRKQRNKRKFIVCVAVILIAGVIAAGVYFLTQSIQKVKEASEGIEKATALVSEADEVIVRMDETIFNTLSSDSVSVIPQLVDELPAVEVKLADALTLVQNALSANLDNEKQNLASQLVVSIKARQAMIEKGRMVLESDVAAANAMVLTNDAWAKILEGFDYIEKASAGKPGSSSTISNDKKAISAFEDALSIFDEIESGYSLADFSQLIEYTTYYKEAAEYALKADQAYAKDKSKYNTYIEKFSALQKKADALVEEFPANPESIVNAAYQANVEEAMAEYIEARNSAASGDEHIREYLNIELSDSEENATKEEDGQNNSEEEEDNSSNEGSEK